MDTFKFLDIYATKGLEYLIILGFMASLFFFQKYFVAERTARSEETKGFLASLLEITGTGNYLGQMRWNPVMSYMKNPNETEEKKSDPNGGNK